MTKQELREKILGLATEAIRAGEMRQGCTNHSYYAGKLTDQINTLIKENYVRLADDQSLPYLYERDYKGIEGTSSKAQQDMFRKGWRKVAL